MKHEGFANREGLEFRIFNYEDGSLALDIDYVNSSTLEFNSDHVAATAGVHGAEAVIFDEALKGTFKFSTQIIPIELIAVLSSPDAVTEGCTTSEKEEVTVAAGGTATLKMAPVAGSVCAYSADACKVGIDTPIANVTVADTTITIPEATEGAKYIVYYLASQANATTVKFSDTLSPGYYSLYGKTNYKGTKNNKCSEYNHFYKLRPQKALNLTYQGTGDPMSLEITFDILSDDNGDFYDHGRINPKKN